MSDNDTFEKESFAKSRSRRAKTDKTGRAAALERLKNLKGKGVKNKYEVSDVKNVYDVVDEDEYSERVNKRLKDDWIVDDGTGYCENGLELFDDDLADEGDVWNTSSKKDKDAKIKKRQTKEEKESAKARFQSVRDMLTNMPQKRKRNEIEPSSSKDTQEDDLGNLMQELHEEKKVKIASCSSKVMELAEIQESLLERSKIRKAPVDHMKNVIVKRKFQGYKTSEKAPPPVLVKLESEESKTEYDNSDLFSSDILEDDDAVLLESLESNHFEVDPTKTLAEMNQRVCSTVSSERDSSVADAFKNEDGKSKMAYNINSIEKFQLYVKQESILSSEASEQGSSDMMKKDADGSFLNFYWMDICEEPRNPGHLYLFGKVRTSPDNFASCCIVLKNVERVLYLLPRERKNDGSEINFIDLHTEFSEEISPRFKINQFKCKKAEKRYCFGLPDVPAFSEYLEVRYSGTIPPLPDNLEGKTFAKVFGSTSPLMENFLLEKQIKGPCWLQLKNPLLVDVGKQHSWCKFEFSGDVGDVCIKKDAVKDNLDTPPLVVVSINVQTVPDVDSKKDIIVGVGVAVNRKFEMGVSDESEGLFDDHFILLHKPPGCIWPIDFDKYMNKQTFKLDSERSMLGMLLAKLQQIDADAYVGHDLNFEVLFMHLIHHKVTNWSRFGRLRRSTHLMKNGKLLDTRSLVAGRLLCDLKISAMELIRARSYDLASLATQVLGMKEDAVASYVGSDIRMFFESSEGIRHFIGWTMEHCLINIKLVNQLQVFPLAMQITAIAGNTLSRTLMGGRSERNEFLLLHAFYNRGYIVPDKYQRSGRKLKKEAEGSADKGEKTSGPSYAGGLVLDPKKGFYDNFIILMDFNSLYPSIIQEFNVCFTATASDDSVGTSKEKGVLPEEIRILVESRKQVKRLMQADNITMAQKAQFDIRQKALKLTANSMYGCLGFKNSRFYAKQLAADITGKGREILLKTKDTVEKMGFEVIYGDTDSIMINSNSQDLQKVYQIGNQIKAEINKQYRLLELEIDGIFRFMLLLKKKKYAALVYSPGPSGIPTNHICFILVAVETTLELKGLDMVRRDWAPVAASTARLILDEIMTEQSLDDKIYKAVKILNDVGAKLRGGEVQLKDLLITKQLAKNPEEYKGSSGLYHVEVALRMNKSGKLAKKFKNGDTVSYVFCNDGHAHHLTEVGTPIERQIKSETNPSEETNSTSEETETLQIKMEGETLQPDPLYYLSHQIHPVVSRICEPIPGLDAAHIAECLGLDPSTFRKKRVTDDVNPDDKYLGEESEEEKYRDCKRFTFTCMNKECRRNVLVDSPFVGSGSKIKFALMTCAHCDEVFCKENLKNIRNSLTLFLREVMTKFYKNVYVCEDPSCTYADRRVPIKLFKGYSPCRCKQALMYKEFNDSELYKQISYLLYVFDVSKHLNELTEEEKRQIHMLLANETGRFAAGMFDALKDMVIEILNRCAYSEINLKSLFQDIVPHRALA